VIVFLTGASGLVGSAYARAAIRRGHHVVGVVGDYTGTIAGVSETVKVDLADLDATTSALLDAFPEAIVNCAAVASPEACETDPARAQALNVALPAQLALLARHVSARFVHLSSEQVFDGAQTTPYRLSDPTAPINLYGRQKLESEKVVHAKAADHAVTLRAPLLMGNSLTGQRSTHERLFLDWSAGRAPRLFTDELRQTCTAENLAEVMLELTEREDILGVRHWAGAELMSRHALGVRIREHFKLTERQAPLLAVSRQDVPEVARKRQPCLALDFTPLAGKLKTRPQSLVEQLEELKIPVPAREWYLKL